MGSTGLWPFRLGTTSYIVPDDIIPNVRYLAGKVEDIELVLFESDEFSNLPSPEDMKRLAGLAAEHALTYSVHLPLDVYLGNGDRKERERSVGKCRRIVELTRDLPKSAYVMHFEAGPGVDINAMSSDGVRRFVDALHESTALLLACTDEPPASFCAENLNYPFELVFSVIEEAGLSVTLDVGHIEYYGFPLGEYLQRYLPRTKVLHMHGTLDGKDHNSLQHMRPEALGQVIAALAGDEGCRGGAGALSGGGDGVKRVFTLEIFSEADFISSCCALERFAHAGSSGGAICR